MDSGRAEPIELLVAKGMDWEYLMSLARRHRMMPLLYWHLSTICPESVPPLALRQLQDHFRTNSRRNLILVAELLELLSLFEDNGIPAIPYKGPVLASWVYGNVSLRQFCDLDILVPKSLALKARDLLISRGYQPNVHLSASHQTAYLEAQCEFCQVNIEKRVAVEVHWDIVPSHMAFPIDLQQLWQRLVPISFAGTTVRSFPPEDLLLILCVHGTKHRWERLDWICGVSELIRRHHEINWKRVTEQA
ncbi:MAG TPA: nucleotidyltransferase family protein, partial [Acidobacteriota bacterium]|nr:nucleotidyltransferase family protein [Acidobacteriota bacterium]